jgi:uncharacterized membrane protein YgcG
MAADAHCEMPRSRAAPSRLPPHLLSAGVANLGDGRRVRRVLAKLNAGLPIVLSAIGSSVTAQFGGAIAPMQRAAGVRTNAGLRRWSNRSGSAINRGWLVDLFHWINITWPHPGHRVVNCGEAATVIAYYSLCTASVVEPEADLIVVEPLSTAPALGSTAFAPGGTGFASAAISAERWMAGFESVLRAVLLLPSRPALLILNVWSPCILDSALCNAANLTKSLGSGSGSGSGGGGSDRGSGGGSDRGSGSGNSNRNSSHSTLGWSYARLLPSYRASRDDHATQVAAYYGLPVASIRALFFHRLASGELRPSDVIADRTGVHPTLLGTRYMSSLLIHVLLAAASGGGDLEGKASSQGGRLGSLVWAAENASWQANAWGDGTPLRPIPPPAWADFTSPRGGPLPHVTRPALQYCYSFDPDQTSATRPPALLNTGWALEMEHNGKIKPGLRATTAGVELRLRLPLGSAGRAVADGTLDVRYIVSSHERLGSALFSCALPCSCDAQRIEGYSGDAYQTTLTRLAHLPFRTVTTVHERPNASGTDPLVGRTGSCELRVRAIEQEGAGPHSTRDGAWRGFKLMGLGATVYSFVE